MILLQVLRTLRRLLETVAEVDVDMDMVVHQGEDVDAEIKVQIITFTVVGLIIHLTSARTSLVNLSELRLLTLSYFGCYLLHCCSYCVDLSRRL